MSEEEGKSEVGEGWNMEVIRAHTSAVYSLHHPPHQPFFFSGSGDGIILLWDFSDLHHPQPFARVNGPVLSMVFDEGSQALLAGTLRGTLSVHSFSERVQIGETALHPTGIFDLKIFGENILSAGGDGQLSFSDPEGKTIWTKKISDQSLRRMALSNELLAIGSSDHCIHLLEMNGFEKKQVLKKHTGSVFTVAFDPSGSVLVSGSRDGHIGKWNLNKEASFNDYFPAHYFTVNDLAFNWDGSLMASASRDKTIKVWNGKDLSFVRKIQPGSPGHSINALFWHEDHLVAAGDGKDLFILNLNFK